MPNYEQCRERKDSQSSHRHNHEGRHPLLQKLQSMQDRYDEWRYARETSHVGGFEEPEYQPQRDVRLDEIREELGGLGGEGA